jgi:hypothetical protein
MLPNKMAKNASLPIQKRAVIVEDLTSPPPGNN